MTPKQREAAEDAVIGITKAIFECVVDNHEEGYSPVLSQDLWDSCKVLLSEYGFTQIIQSMVRVGLIQPDGDGYVPGPKPWPNHVTMEFKHGPN